MRILFDNAHDELLSNNDSASGPNTSLNRLWDRMAKAPNSVSQRNTPLTITALRGFDVLVLAGPQAPLKEDEIAVVDNFVRRGHGLLLAHDHSSLFGSDDQLKQRIQATRRLTERFGFQFRERFGTGTDTTTDLAPHAVTSNLIDVLLPNPCRIETSASARALGLGGQPPTVTMVSATAQTGRVIGLASTAVLSDLHAEHPQVDQFLRNIFAWLAHESIVDIVAVECPARVEVGQPVDVSVTLGNDSTSALEEVDCTLVITPAVRTGLQRVQIPFMASRGRAQAAWSIDPRTLGEHALSLRLSLAYADARHTFVYANFARFTCVLPAQLHVQPIDTVGRAITDVQTDTPFFALGSVFWQTSIPANDFTPHLEVDVGMRITASHAEARARGSTTEYTWPLICTESGYKQLAFRVLETGQTTRVGLLVKPSIERRIRSLEQQHVEPLTEAITRQLSQLCDLFGSEEMRALSFRIRPADKFATELYSGSEADRALDVLASARVEEDENVSLLNEVLRYFSPTYTAATGGSVPYEPDLAERLARLFPAYRETILFQLLGGINSIESELRATIASCLLHEKFGHGFFAVHTTVGRQLGLLEAAGWLDEGAASELRSPYPHDEYMQFKDAIRVLEHSVMTLNEGFSAWLELTYLARLEPDLSRIVPARARFVQNATRLRDLAMTSEYFAVHQPTYDSPYRVGYERLESIRRAYGATWGERVALEALLYATDVDFGIRALGAHPQFALSAENMKARLLQEEGSAGNCEMRLIEAERELLDRRDQIVSGLEDRGQDWTCGDESGPIGAMLRTVLGG